MQPNEEYEIKNEQVEKVLKELARWIGSAVPPGWGFTLLMFEFGEKGSLFYISNAQREDMIKTMEEFIAKRGWAN